MTSATKWGWGWDSIFTTARHSQVQVCPHYLAGSDLTVRNLFIRNLFTITFLSDIILWSKRCISSSYVSNMKGKKNRPQRSRLTLSSILQWTWMLVTRILDLKYYFNVYSDTSTWLTPSLTILNNSFSCWDSACMAPCLNLVQKYKKKGHYKDTCMLNVKGEYMLEVKGHHNYKCVLKVRGHHKYMLKVKGHHKYMLHSGPTLICHHLFKCIGHTRGRVSVINSTECPRHEVN